MANDVAQKELDKLKKDISELREDMSKLVSTVKDIGQGMASAAKETAEDKVNKTIDDLNRAYVSARQTGEQAAKRVHSEIENYPVASLAVAFAAGLVAGKLFSAK